MFFNRHLRLKSLGDAIIFTFYSMVISLFMDVITRFQ